MDRKSIIILVACLLLLMLWQPLVVNKLYPPKPHPIGLTNSAPATVTGTNPAPAAAAPQTAPVTEAPVPFEPWLAASAPEQLIQVTNGASTYTFTSYGGGLKEVALLDYPETVTTHYDKKPTPKRVAMLNGSAPAPVLALMGNTLQEDGLFQMSRTPRGVRAQKTLTNGLVIIKDFTFETNYLVTATVRFENHTAQALALPPHEWVAGTATPLGPRDSGTTVGVMWYNGLKSEDEVGMSIFSSRGFGCVPRTPPAEFRAGAGNVVWVAAHNQFFSLAVMPDKPAESLVMRKISLPLVETNAPAPFGYQTALVYPGQSLAPNQSIEHRVSVFAGPKEYQTLARLNERFTNIDLIMGYSGFFGFFAKALLLTMNWLHATLYLPYGLAIVAITVLIKAIFWPLTASSTRSMKRMQALQPQMQAIKDKYKDDPMKMNRKTMEFMKENKVSPLGGCLPMVLQIPIFFGFYRMIQSAIELRGAHFLWVPDLSQSDTLFVIPSLASVPIFGVPGVGLPFNLLPLLMGATMLWQSHLTPASPSMDQTQAKMMRYMPLIFMVGLYNFSAGLTLYWTVNNLLTILQTKLTKTESPATSAAAVLTPAPKKRK
jgi:YidC/Oxa1 family membrane protein insertase